jgi:predicted transcriptional regulator
MELRKKKSLETITAKEIIGYVFSNMVIVKGEIKLKDKDQVEAGVEENLREYAENWASENAKEWLIEHAP